MPKSLLQILHEPFAKPTTRYPNQSGMTPLAGEKGVKDMLKNFPIQVHPEPYENDFTAGVKTFNRAANRYGHDNVDYNNQTPSRTLRNPTLNVATEAFIAVDAVGLGNKMDWRVVNVATSKYETRKMQREDAIELAAELNQAYVEQLDEAKLYEEVTRKHFRMAANTIRAIESPEKRQEHADLNAKIYSSQNPRFDHKKWHSACGTKTKKERGVREETFVAEVAPPGREDRQIDELSQGKLYNYTIKASDDYRRSKKNVRKSGQTHKYKWIKRRNKRAAGLTTAFNKMSDAEVRVPASEETIDEVPPPGRENQVKALKKKFPKASAFKIAWASYNKSKGEETELDEIKRKFGSRAKTHTESRYLADIMNEWIY